MTSSPSAPASSPASPRGIRRRARRLLVAGALVVSAVALSAGPAAADPIGQLQVNGSSASVASAGFSASDVTFSGGRLEVNLPMSEQAGVLSEVDGTLNDSSVSITHISLLTLDCTWSGPNFQCPVGFVGPGSNAFWDIFVWGVNAGGLSNSPAVKKFTLG